MSQFASTMSASDMAHAGAPRDPDHYTIKAGAMIFCGILMLLTAIFAVVEFSNRDLKDAFVRLEHKLDKKFELIDKKFERIDLKIDALDRKIDAVDRKVDGLQIEMAHVKQHLEKDERRLDTVEPRLIKLEKHVELTRPAARGGLR